MSKFHYGTKSIEELKGVHPKLILVCGVALYESKDVDWGVFDGLRTREEQEENVARGVSWTMDSDHLVQEDGFGHAVDLVPYISGRYRWDSIEAFKEIGRCMRLAAESMKVRIEWGANVKHGGDWRKKNDMAHFALKGE